MTVPQIVEDCSGLGIGTDAVAMMEFDVPVLSEELGEQEGDGLFLELVHAMVGARESQLECSHFFLSLLRTARSCGQRELMGVCLM